MTGGRPKKHRVEFRKNRTQQARNNDLTRDVRQASEHLHELHRDERVSGRGNVARRRTVVGEVTADDQILREIDTSKCLTGRVLSAIGTMNCTVRADDGTIHECSVRRVVRTLSRDSRNAVVAGDCVQFLPVGPGEGVIERVEPRNGVLSRGQKHRQHILVANVTQLLIVGSAESPTLKPALIDRFIVSALNGGLRPVICINKVDLVQTANLQAIVGLYSRLGYGVVLTSVATGRGIPRLRELLSNQQTVFSGQSGVGKSSLLNAVQHGLELKVGEVSDWSRKGKHTTRFAQFLPLDFGGWVVDTPGIRQLELWGVARENVEAFFVEFRPFVPYCKFPNCLHLEETDCAVRQAVQMDLISRLRYESYLRIVLGDDMDPDE